MKIKDYKEERIEAAQLFAKKLEMLFEDYYKDHKPPFFIFICRGHIDKETIKVFNGYSVGLIGEKDQNLISLVDQ